ncbi:hypothetical protein FHS83_003322 [Rhizomicrobium palustre]|uniref:Uncharacterized protein n=1 Tax=Rhizomicrobium palustre TaxID=189966 RepID=A0A846N202_9PROT|nr:hypothetical protein [Rhizomicrobium palustre]NIK90004.1 hypothetical protein [Rhizomicrobium palustre]
MRLVFNACLATAWVVLGGFAFAAGDQLDDNALVSRAQSVQAVKDPPVDRVLGLHRGLPVVVDVRCGDVCPQNTVRFIHYIGQTEAACAQTRGDIVSVDVPKGITSGQEKFCVPHILVRQKLYIDRPFQR